MYRSSNTLVPKFIVYLVFIGTLECRHPQSSSESGTLDKMPFAADDVEPKLGEGYDSLIQQLRNTPSCIKGTPVKLSSTGVNINFEQNVDSRDMMREFTGEVQGTPRIVFLPVGVGAGFYRSISNKSSSIGIVFGVKIHAGGEKITDVSFSKDIKTITTAALYRMCGDSYVMQINRGGLLAVTLNMDFGSEENRIKWQTKLNFSGGLGDLSTDLKDKIQEQGIDGTLSINVNQIGGAPDQAILGLKTCTMGSMEEFSACRDLMDKLLSYGTTQFPAEVMKQPAILNYITTPLKNLGATDLPVLDGAVLEARRNLEQLQKEINFHFEMKEKSKKVGLFLDAGLAEAIDSNKKLITQVASACFSHTITDNGVNWSSCLDSHARLKDQLKHIPRGATEINELNILAHMETGQSIVNPYTQRMNVVYAVTTQSTWSPGTVAKQGKDHLLSPYDSIGSLLLRTEAAYQTVSQNGQVDIYPGESVAFIMNDLVGRYGDNQGSRVVYWRCTNCNESMKKVATHRLVVKAGAEGGSVFRLREPKINSYRFFAYGRWGISSSSSLTDAHGSQERCSSNCPLPAASKQALIMSGSSGTKALGREGCIVISPDSTVTFSINDERGKYGDNRGEMELILQAHECGLKSHPLSGEL